MAIKGAEYAVSRIIATLQAYLLTETALVDAEMADGIPLDDVAAADYYDTEMELGHIPNFPAIVVDVKATAPIEIRSITNSPGLYHAEHAIDVSVHLRDNGNETPSILKKRILRYARAIERVLAIKYPTLASAGVETVIRVYRQDDATYVMEGQAPGEFVRSARLPFTVVTYEQL